MQGTQVEKRSRAKDKKEEIPEYLIYEVMDGKPIYRKGYRDVMNKTKTLEEIMAISSLQGTVLEYLLRILFRHLDEDKYHIYPNEIGIHLDHKNNRASDIGIYETTVVPPEKISSKWLDVPAKLFIEVDIKAELEDTTENGYIRSKSQDLLDFGAEKIIWVLTVPKLVIIATQGKFEMLDWNETVEMLEGLTFNIGKYFKAKGYNPNIK